MKIKELEKLINEKVIEEGLDKKEMISRDIVWEIERIVYHLLRKQYDEKLYVYNYKGKVIVKNSCAGKYSPTIEINIKKKVVGATHKIFSNDTLYNVVKVEIPVEEDFTIEDFIKDYEEGLIRKQNYEEEKLNNFEKQLKEKNIEFKDFYKMMEEYKNLNYDKKRELAKKYVGEKYYSYL